MQYLSNQALKVSAKQKTLMQTNNKSSTNNQWFYVYGPFTSKIFFSKKSELEIKI